MWSRHSGGGGQRCRHCCEICHRPTKRTVRIDNRERLLCRSCDALRKRSHKGKGPRHRWQRLYYFVEGEAKAYRCKHGSSSFVVAIAEKDTTMVVCIFGYRHELLTGFFFDNEISR
jgi:hypothetical protein